MADILTTWDGQHGAWQTAGADLASDDGLQSAVVISLFTNAAATVAELAAAGLTERQGWWADALEGTGDRIGSKLWLLTREKRTPQTLERARRYAAEALQWMLDDGVVEAVDVTAEALGTDVLALGVVITRKREPVAAYRFETFWKGL